MGLMLRCVEGEREWRFYSMEKVYTILAFQSRYATSSSSSISSIQQRLPPSGVEVKGVGEACMNQVQEGLKKTEVELAVIGILLFG